MTWSRSSSAMANDVRALCEQFDAKPAEIRQLFHGALNPQRSAELIDEMRAAGLPV